ncbi:MAG: hypothetical protein K2Q33_08800 [Gammaproteobacteria bacterium]|nr:hypothetical protein [Gammaproteobacteria bacterium]
MKLRDLAKDNAILLMNKSKQFPDLIERANIETPWNIVEEVCNNNFEHVDEEVALSLNYDVVKVSAAGL